MGAIAGAYAYIPTGHIQAGEVSGNIDGASRHAIGKLAHLHFASNDDAYSRLINLGEEKKRIFKKIWKLLEKKSGKIQKKFFYLIKFIVINFFTLMKILLSKRKLKLML